MKKITNRIKIDDEGMYCYDFCGDGNFYTCGGDEMLIAHLIEQIVDLKKVLKKC